MENLQKAGHLGYQSRCNKCMGFRQGKCAYGYQISNYRDITYRSDGTKYNVIKGRPLELCSKAKKY